MVRNPKLHEESEYERIKAGYREAGKWSFFLHLLVAPIVAKYGFGKLYDYDHRKKFIKGLKEALSRVKVTDVKAHLHGYEPDRIGDLKNGFLLPPLEEVLQDPEKRKEFVSWLRVALRDVGVSTYEDEIDKMIDRIYPLAVKMLDRFLKIPGGFDRRGNPITGAKKEEVKQWEEFWQYLKILQEFADVKLEQPEPTIAQKRAQPVERIQTEERTIIRTSNPEVSASLGNAKLEVLSMLQALRLLNYSEDAVNNAILDFKKKISEILTLETLTLEDVYRLGIYYLALNYIRERKFEKAEKTFTRL